MTCANCGNNVAEGSQACPRCGTLVSRDVTSPQDKPAWTPAGGPGGPAGPSGSYGPAGPSGPYGPGGTSGPVHHTPTSSGFNFDAARWTRSDKIAGVASLVVLIALFLPWFSGSISSDNTLGLAATSGSESGTAAHGWLWLVFIIALLIVAYLVCAAGFQVLPVKLPLRHDQLLLVAAGVNLLLVFVAFLFKPSTGGIAGLSIGWSIGAFLALIAAIVAVAALTPPGRERLDSGVPTAGR